MERTITNKKQPWWINHRVEIKKKNPQQIPVGMGFQIRDVDLLGCYVKYNGKKVRVIWKNLRIWRQ